MFLDILLPFPEGIYFVFRCRGSLLRRELNIRLSVPMLETVNAIFLEAALPLALSVHFVFTECYLF